MCIEMLGRHQSRGWQQVSRHTTCNTTLLVAGSSNSSSSRLNIELTRHSSTKLPMHECRLLLGASHVLNTLTVAECQDSLCQQQCALHNASTAQRWHGPYSRDGSQTSNLRMLTTSYFNLLTCWGKHSCALMPSPSCQLPP